MMRKINIYLFTLLLTVMVSCSSEFTDIIPPIRGTLLEEEIFTDIQRARTFINPAYTGVQAGPNLGLATLTTNLVNITPNRLATGGYNAETSPVNGVWGNAYRQIFHINEFLEYGFDVPFNAFDPELSLRLQKRVRGEAFGLRAYFKWLLLKNYSGPSSEGGELLGFPIIDTEIDPNDANDIPRNTFEECYRSIIKDIDTALVNMDIQRYQGLGVADGEQETGRISREVLWALKSRVALFAASPSYAKISWADAAGIIYDAITEIEGGEMLKGGPLTSFDEYNSDTNIDYFWRNTFRNNANLEVQNYPPSMFGNGQFNPTQNIVDAFPDANGYPIDHPNSVYDADDPYTNRDDRLETFVFFNGPNTFQPELELGDIETFVGGLDASGGLLTIATRTGYYLKKFLNPETRLDPDRPIRNALKIYPIFTRGGLYLDFAEAALEAFPADGQGPFAFSAKDAIRKIRERGGLDASTDLYLDEAAADLNLFREMIRNERRIEFAFEGEYFYDVRRWMLPLDELQEPVLGALIIKNDDSSFTFSTQRIEERVFSEFYYYNPIPRSQVLISNALIQNAGW